mmetsp:Transcript_866/g.1362  ORF Transcript_866/g.1362 Transcript_866/m.1362 type:complete len:326 (-) Transcript_866:315-1292(-)
MSMLRINIIELGCFLLLILNIAVTPGSNHHIIIANIRQLAGFRSQFVVLQDNRKNRLDLKEGEDLTHTRVHSTAETQVGIGELVLFSRCGESIGVKFVRILECGRKSHGNSRRDNHNVVFGYVVSLSIDSDTSVLHDLTEQHDESGAHSECFTHTVMQEFHLMNIIQFQGVLVVELFLFFHDSLQNSGIVQEEEKSPGAGRAGSVLSRKEQGNQQTRHFFLCNRRPVLVFDIHKEAQNISSIGSFRMFSAFLDYFSKKFDQLLACLVTSEVFRCRSTTPQDCQRCQSFIQVMIQGLKLGKHMFSHIISVQASRGSQNGELTQGLI